MAKTSSHDSSFDSCVTCASKYNKIRPSLCQCKHCSQSFCFDCMKDHNNDLQQNIAELSNLFNEVKQSINTKRQLIKNETIKSKEQLSEWLRKFIDNLNVEKAKIDTDIGNAEKEAQKFVLDIEAELQTTTTDIDAFTKTSTFQSVHMEKLLQKIDELKQKISPLAATRENDLPSTMPKYKFQFNYSTKSTTDNSQQTSTVSEQQDEGKSNTTEQPKIEDQYQSDAPVSDIKTSECDSSDISFPGENYFCNRDKFEQTSYIVSCMASDEINIMYSTIEDSQHERIAYCYLNDDDSLYRQADPSRIWNQSRIVDMVWWDSIDKFICATEKGIYSVNYFDEKFRILSVINGPWAQVCIAVNTDYIWVHTTGKIMIYNINFEIVRSINFRLPPSLTRASFCVTNNIVAFALIRRVKDNRDILQVQFYDCDMKRQKRVQLGLSEPSCVIRTDGNDRFYVAMGQQRFHILSPNGDKQTVNLGKQAGCLAVVNSQSIVLTKSRSDLELVKC